MRTGRTLRRAAGVLVAAFVVTTAVAVEPAVAQRDDAANCSQVDRNGANGGQRGRSLYVLGLTADQRLICFSERTTEQASTIGQISGLTDDSTLVGMDYRPSNNTLYGVGNAGGVYTIDAGSAAATKVAQLSVALDGTSFGVDVNPAADALRIISDTGQNLRFSFSAGTTTADTPLMYPGASGQATGVTGAAYTNNDADPNTATTLYVIDSTMDQVVVQSPANSGQLAATGKLTVDTNARVGFDIYSSVRDETTVNVRAFASLTVDGQSRFYRISLVTGRASLIGVFSSQNTVTDIAVPLNQ